MESRLACELESHGVIAVSYRLGISDKHRTGGDETGLAPGFPARSKLRATERRLTRQSTRSRPRFRRRWVAKGTLSRLARQVVCLLHHDCIPHIERARRRSRAESYS
jgi:hypothetical protein